MMDIEAIRALALALPEVTEEPHFDYGAFRVRGKIFVTVPPDRQHIHVMLDEQQRLLTLATEPRGIEPLHWGKQIPGVRIELDRADPAQVAHLVETAWRYRAPKRLAAAFDRNRSAPP